MSNLHKTPPPLQEMKSLPCYRAIICAEINVSMTGGTMINALSNYGMSLGKKAELCKGFHCTEEKAKSLIKSNPVIFTSCYQGLEIFVPSELCQHTKEGRRLMHCDSG